MERDGQPPQTAPVGSRAKLVKDLARGVGKGARGGRLTRRLLPRRTYLSPPALALPQPATRGRGSAGAGSGDPHTPTHDMPYNNSDPSTPTVTPHRRGNTTQPTTTITFLAFFFRRREPSMAAAVTEGCRATPQRRESRRPRPGPPATPATAIPPRLHRLAHRWWRLLLQRLKEQVRPRQESGECVWATGALHVDLTVGLTQPPVAAS